MLGKKFLTLLLLQFYKVCTIEMLYGLVNKLDRSSFIYHVHTLTKLPVKMDTFNLHFKTK